jgi:hypothetical protein
MAIAKKLGAKIYTGRGKHDRAVVVHEGKAPCSVSGEAHRETWATIMYLKRSISVHGGPGSWRIAPWNGRTGSGNWGKRASSLHRKARSYIIFCAPR